MADPRAVPTLSERVRGWVGRTRREISVRDGYPWYRAGYIQALDDIERTGLRPTTDQTKRRAADRALKRWVDYGD